jgi:hypothetical protein
MVMRFGRAARLLLVVLNWHSVGSYAAILGLAGAVACGGSSRRDPESRQSGGTGGSATGGRDNQETGGAASGATGGRAEAGGRAGGANVGGSSALAGQGTGAAAGASAGAHQTGGAAGTSAGQAGSGGLPSAPYVPPWLPTGAFGDAAQRLVEATTEYTFWLCAANGLSLAECTRAELHNFAPSLEWLACASRSGSDAALDDLASNFFACATEMRQCGCQIVVCDFVIPAIEGCPSYQSHACPSGETFAYRCDEYGTNDCSDGYDQRNCDPTAARYDCGDSGFIDWTDVCDGSPDCANEVDEFRCGPTNGEGGAAGAASG